jgi:hypothetical protein
VSKPLSEQKNTCRFAPVVVRSSMSSATCWSWSPRLVAGKAVVRAALPPRISALRFERILADLVGGLHEREAAVELQHLLEAVDPARGRRGGPG